MSTKRTNHIKTALVDETLYMINTLTSKYHCSSSRKDWAYMLASVKSGDGITYKKLPWKDFVALEVTENYLVIG